MSKCWPEKGLGVIPGSEDSSNKESKKRRKETAREQGMRHSKTLIEHQLCAALFQSNLSENRGDPYSRGMDESSSQNKAKIIPVEIGKCR